MKTYLSVLILALLAIAGGIYFYLSHTHTGEVACTTEAMLCPDGSAVGRTGPNCSFAPCPGVSTEYKNGTYIIDGRSTTLINGVSRAPAAPGSASQVTTTYFGNEATGDLNGDGVPDVAFLLTQNSGGSGTFYYVVVALKTPQGYQGTNAILLGDRIAPQTTEIRNGELIVNYVDRNPGEPMTAQPSLGVSKYMLVEKGSLVEVPALAADLYPLYSGASWGPVAATTSPDYGPVAVVQSTPFTNLTDIAAKSTPFTAYYRARLLKAGWVQDMLREAGGPGSEVSVYTKGTQFIVVSFRSVFHVQPSDAPEQCPCDLQFSLMNGVENGSK